MRRQATFLALALASMFEGAGNLKAARITENSAGNSMGNSPFYMPSKSRRVKNKLNRLRK